MMTTTDVKSVIVDYLRTDKRLVVPQLGAFIAKTPGGEVLFSELFKRDDGVLRGLLTAAGASEIEAAGAIDRLAFDLRHAVQEGGSYLIEGLGRFTAGVNGTLLFTYDTRTRLTARPLPPKPAPKAVAADRPAAGAASTVVPPTPAPQPEPAATQSESGGQQAAAATEPRRKKENYGPDPYVKGLTYGKPVKTTDPYTYVGSRPRRRIDAFMVVAIIAGLLALGIIVYVAVGERNIERGKAELLMEETTATDEPVTIE